MITKFQRNVFIDSEINSVGNGQVSKINFPPSAFNVAPKEQMKMTLTSFEMRRNWYPVNPTNNTFYWYDPTAALATQYIPIVVLQGNYDSFADAPLTVASLLGAILAAINLVPALAGTTATYSEVSRKYTFVIPAGLPAGSGFVAFQVKQLNQLPTGITSITPNGFFNDSAELLGGYPTRDNFGAEPLDLFSGLALNAGVVPAVNQISPFVTALNTLEAIYIRTNLHSGNYQTYGFEKDLPNQQGLTPTQIFARIPLSRAYFDPQFEFISFEDPNALFSMFLQQTQLSQVFFTITDDKGRLIQEVAVGQAAAGNLSFKMSFAWEVLVDELPPDEKRLKLENLQPKFPNLTLN